MCFDQPPSSSTLTSLPTNVLSSILKKNSLSPVCAAHELCWAALSCVPIHWSVVDLSGAIPLKNTDSSFLRSCQLSRAPHLGVGAGEPLPMLSCRCIWSCAPPMLRHRSMWSCAFPLWAIDSFDPVPPWHWAGDSFDLVQVLHEQLQ